jgi:nucleotide-binding universal stress UspA family protein
VADRSRLLKAIETGWLTMSTGEATSHDPSEIVVGVDGSEPSRRALAWATRQAKLTGATVHAVIAWEPPIAFGFEPVVGLGWDFAADALKALEQVVDETVGPDRTVDVRASAIEGRPAPVLIQAAETAELLVVGHRGRGAFPGMTLGSVAVHCVQHASCPVVVVRHGRSDPGEGPPDATAAERHGDQAR